MRIVVDKATVGPPVPAGFVGLASEYSDIEKEVGTNPAQPDVPFEQLVRNLASDGGLILRIGGDSTDWTWWPVPRMKQPGWVRYTLTPTWAAVTQKLAEDLKAHMILGINMEADNPKVARTEVNALAAGLGSSVTATYEVGNEPELYSKFPFYRFPTFHAKTGGPIRGRPKGYSYSDITSDWIRIAGALPHPLRLAGPGYTSTNALPFITQFLTSARRLSLLTVHNYPLRSPRCGGGTLEESQLFQPAALQDLADNLNAWTKVAHKFAVPVRVDEINAVTCGGLPNFSDTFGPALWALNILPLYVEAGVQGVNFETRPSTAQNLIQPSQTASGWQVTVQPEYYGLLAFAQLTPPGSHLLEVSSSRTGLYTWAVRTPGQGRTVVATNATAKPTTVTARVAGARGPASVRILGATAGGLSATAGVSLGGQTISPTTGQLTGTPVTTSIRSSHGVYRIQIPADSAAILTVSP